MKTMYFIKIDDNAVVGFAKHNGVGLVSAVIDRQNKTDRQIEQTFSNRFAAQNAFHDVKGDKMRWNFVWLDYDKVIESNQPVLPIPPAPKAKPKLYEIKKQDTGFLVVKHDEELLTEDEVKLALFAKSANE